MPSVKFLLDTAHCKSAETNPDCDKVKQGSDAILKELREISKQNPGMLSIEPKRLEELVNFLGAMHKKCRMNTQQPGIKELYPHIVLWAGMLVQHKETINGLTDDASDAVLYSILGSKIPYKKILQLPLDTFYADPLTTVLSNTVSYLLSRREILKSYDQTARVIAVNMTRVNTALESHMIYANKFMIYLRQPKRGSVLFTAAQQQRWISFFSEQYSNNQNADPMLTQYATDAVIRTNVRLFAIYVGSDTDANYKVLLDAVTRKFSIYPLETTEHCLKFVIKQQANMHQIMVRFETVALRLLRFVVFLLEKPEIDNKIKQELLYKIKKNCKHQAVAIFGNLIATALLDCRVFATEILELVYDLRLGLHDIQHLNNQADRLLELYYPRKQKRHKLFTPESLNAVWGYVAGTSLKIKRRLACLQFGDDLQLSKQEVRGFCALINLMAANKNMNALVASAGADVVELQKAAIQEALSAQCESILGNQIDLIRLTVKLKLHIKHGENALEYMIMPVLKEYSILRANAENYVFYNPELPQEYIRFSNAEYSLIAGLIFDEMQNALQRFITKNTGYTKLNCSLCCVIQSQACLNFPQQLRRSETPYDPRLFEQAASEPGIPRAKSSAYLGPGS
jgi:hypothetical protein